MSTAPIKRDDQIKLMESHEERRAAFFASVSGDPSIKDSLFQNNAKAKDTHPYRRDDRKVPRCS